MCWPGTSAPASHPGAGLGSGLMLHRPVWLCCCLLSSLLVFSSPSKLEIYLQKEPGGSPQPHPQTSCVHRQEGNQNICSPSPSQLPTHFYFQAMLVLSWSQVPNSFFLPAVRSRFPHLSLQLVVSRSLIWKPPAVMTRSNERLLIEGPCHHPWPQSCRSC